MEPQGAEHRNQKTPKDSRHRRYHGKQSKVLLPPKLHIALIKVAPIPPEDIPPETGGRQILKQDAPDADHPTHLELALKTRDVLCVVLGIQILVTDQGKC